MSEEKIFKEKYLGEYESVRPSGNIYSATQTNFFEVSMKYKSSPKGRNNYERDYVMGLRDFNKAVKTGALIKQ